MQLEPGVLLVASSTRPFCDLVLQETVVNRTSLHRIRAPRHSVSLLVGLAHTGAQFVDGHELTSDRCVVLEAGAEVELIAHAQSSWLLISATTGFGALARTRRSTPLHAGGYLVERSAYPCPGLEEETANDIHVRGSHPAVSRTLVLALSFWRGIVDPMVDAAPLSAARDERTSRQVGVERARRYIHGHVADPIRLADLCAHARLRARTLEYGFRELVRLSPMGYLRMLRLNEVRSQLLDVCAATRSISEIALDAGFSHLSQFVVDYKKVFGETPSATRRNAFSSIGVDRLQPRKQPSGEAVFATA